MTVIVILSVLILFLCLSAVRITGRARWLIVGMWCVPLIAMEHNTPKSMEINGLLVLVAFSVIFITGCSMIGVKMWNIRRRKSIIVIHIFLFVIAFILAFYVIIYSRMVFDISDLNIFNLDDINFKVGFIIISIPVTLISITVSTMILTFVDRLFCREENLTLIRCRSFVGNEIGGEGILWKGYFVYGINNGIRYDFKVTTRTYIIIKNEKSLFLTVKKGWLGGLYVTKNPCQQNISKVRRRDSRIIKSMSAFILIFIIAVIVYIIYSRGYI